MKFEIDYPDYYGEDEIDRPCHDHNFHRNATSEDSAQEEIVQIHPAQMTSQLYKTYYEASRSHNKF